MEEYPETAISSDDGSLIVTLTCPSYPRAPPHSNALSWARRVKSQIVERKDCVHLILENPRQVRILLSRLQSAQIWAAGCISAESSDDPVRGFCLRVLKSQLSHGPIVDHCHTCRR